MLVIDKKGRRQKLQRHDMLYCYSSGNTCSKDTPTSSVTFTFSRPSASSPLKVAVSPLRATVISCVAA